MEQLRDWPERLNARQAGEYLNLSPPATLKALERGEIPAGRCGRRWIVDRRALDARLGIGAPPAPVRRP